MCYRLTNQLTNRLKNRLTNQRPSSCSLFVLVLPSHVASHVAHHTIVCLLYSSDIKKRRLIARLVVTLWALHFKHLLSNSRSMLGTIHDLQLPIFALSSLNRKSGIVGLFLAFPVRSCRRSKQSCKPGRGYSHRSELSMPLRARNYPGSRSSEYSPGSSFDKGSKLNQDKYAIRSFIKSYRDSSFASSLQSNYSPVFSRLILSISQRRFLTGKTAIFLCSLYKYIVQYHVSSTMYFLQNHVHLDVTAKCSV